MRPKDVTEKYKKKNRELYLLSILSEEYNSFD